MTFDPPASGYTNYTTTVSDDVASVHRQPRRRRDVRLLAETREHYGPNSARSIGCGFVAEHAVQQNPQRLYSVQLVASCATNPQQIDGVQQIHN